MSLSPRVSTPAQPVARLSPPLLGPSSPPTRRRSGWLGGSRSPSHRSSSRPPFPPAPTRLRPPKPPPAPTQRPILYASVPQFTTPVCVHRVRLSPMDTSPLICSLPSSTICHHPPSHLTPLSPPQHPLPSVHCAQGHSFPFLSFRAHPPFTTRTHTPHSIYILPES